MTTVNGWRWNKDNSALAYDWLGSRIIVVKVNIQEWEKMRKRETKCFGSLSWDWEAVIWRVGIMIIISGIVHILFCFSLTIRKRGLDLKFFLSPTQFVRKYTTDFVVCCESGIWLIRTSSRSLLFSPFNSQSRWFSFID